MIPVKWIDVTKTNPKEIRYPAFCQLKVDGELVMWDGYNRKLWNSYGREKSWIKTTSFPKDCMLFGELYYKEGKDFYEYLRNQFSKELKVSFFDVISYERQILYGNEPYSARFKVLFSLPIAFPETTEVANPHEVSALYSEVVKNGYEGLVIKPADSLTCDSWVKVKREYVDRLYILGKKKGKNSLLVGTKDHIYGAVSTLGWQVLLSKAFAVCRYSTIKEDKENIYLDTPIVLEVRHNGYICERESDKEVSLRNPRILRIAEEGADLTLPRV